MKVVIAGAGIGGPTAALARCEARRRPATSALVPANRANGPARVMQRAHERTPGELEGTARPGERVAGLGGDALDARASHSVR